MILFEEEAMDQERGVVVEWLVFGVGVVLAFLFFALFLLFFFSILSLNIGFSLYLSPVKCLLSLFDLFLFLSLSPPLCSPIESFMIAYNCEQKMIL